MSSPNPVGGFKPNPNQTLPNQQQPNQVGGGFKLNSNQTLPGQSQPSSGGFKPNPVGITPQSVQQQPPAYLPPLNQSPLPPLPQNARAGDVVNVIPQYKDGQRGSSGHAIPGDLNNVIPQGVQGVCADARNVIPQYKSGTSDQVNSAAAKGFKANSNVPGGFKLNSNNPKNNPE